MTPCDLECRTALLYRTRAGLYIHKRFEIACTISKKLEATQCNFVDTHLNWSVLGKEMLVEVSRCLALSLHVCKCFGGSSWLKVPPSKH